MTSKGAKLKKTAESGNSNGAWRPSRLVIGIADALSEIRLANECDSVSRRIESTENTIERFADQNADVLDGGLGNTRVKHAARAIADASDTALTMPQVRQMIESTAFEEHDHGGGTPLDRVLLESLDHVAVDRAGAFTTYEFEFETGVVTVSSRANDTFEQARIRKRYNQNCDGTARPPTRSRRDTSDWWEFVTALVDQRGAEVDA